MKKWTLWTLLAAWALCMALAALLPRASDPASEATETAAPARPTLRAMGEELPLRAYLPDEPVFWAVMGMWRTHPALDIAGETAPALRAGRVARIWEDRLWALCVEVDCGGETWVYRSLSQVFAREGQALRAGDPIGAAGVAPIEEELGAHAHVERTVGGGYADPRGDP